MSRRAPRAPAAAPSARRWCRHRWPRTSSTRVSPRLGCSRKCWCTSTWITCCSTGRKPSSVAPAWPSRARRWPTGLGSAACNCSPWSMRSSAKCSKALRAVVFDFADSRGGQHARAFLGLPGAHGWRGTLVCDDFSGYKACFELGITEAGCLAHARRKFHELWANHGSQVGEQALKFFGEFYAVEHEVAELMPGERRRRRQEKSRKVADALQQWLAAQRQKVPDGSATARAIDYSLKRWQRSRATSTMAICRRTTTGWRSRSGRSPSDDRTGCSLARYGYDSAPRPS